MKKNICIDIINETKLMRWDAAEPENCLVGGESSSPLLRSNFDGVNAGRKQS